MGGHLEAAAEAQQVSIYLVSSCSPSVFFALLLCVVRLVCLCFMLLSVLICSKLVKTENLTLGLMKKKKNARPLRYDIICM